jgi:hypothetical protein
MLSPKANRLWWIGRLIRTSAARLLRGRATIVWLAIAALTAPCPSVFGTIIGGEGNSPIADPGWPAGAAAIFNSSARIAYWVGPPFGGGQWHSECRGDAAAFNQVLAAFAKLDAKRKRVVVHDGIGRSFWLDPNREPAKGQAARLDWVFMVWQPESWERLRNLPADLIPADLGDAAQGPPSQIDVYVGGNIQWPGVVVPEGIEVIDERLEAHGFALTDGAVFEGRVIDLATKEPIAAKTQLELVEPQPTGGYRYTVSTVTAADAKGRWVIKKAPVGWRRLVVTADGYVPRVISYVQIDDQPGWRLLDCGLSKRAAVTGRITDDAGKPLADVQVRLADVVAAPEGRYESPHDYIAKTDDDGQFQLNEVPVGKATVRLHKPGYCRPGLGQSIGTPAKDVALSMMKSAAVRVTVDFAGTTRPEGYLVQMEPEGGAAIGKWSGSGNIDAKNQIAFQEVPPGRYVLQGQPNPSSGDQKTKPLTLDLVGGETTEIKLPVK